MKVKDYIDDLGCNEKVILTNKNDFEVFNGTVRELCTYTTTYCNCEVIEQISKYQFKIDNGTMLNEQLFHNSLKQIVDSKKYMININLNCYCKAEDYRRHTLKSIIDFEYLSQLIPLSEIDEENISCVPMYYTDGTILYACKIPFKVNLFSIFFGGHFHDPYFKDILLHTNVNNGKQYLFLTKKFVTDETNVSPDEFFKPYIDEIKQLVKANNEDIAKADTELKDEITKIAKHLYEIYNAQ